MFFLQLIEHGFPSKPSALAFDPKLKLLAIGTKSGAIRVYPLQSCIHISLSLYCLEMKVFDLYELFYIPSH